MTNEKQMGINQEIENILQAMLAENEDISARAIARKHTQIKATTSITRDKQRVALIEIYKQKQAELRSWEKRVNKSSKVKLADDLSDKDLRIAELEKQVQILTASHVAMIRAVGELGGFPKWEKFFVWYNEAIAACLDNRDMTL